MLESADLGQPSQNRGCIILILAYMMPGSRQVSTNWKALAPIIKSGKALPTTQHKEIWFDIDEETLRRSVVEAKKATSPTMPLSIADLFPRPPTGTHHLNDAGKYIAMDCEMVGVGPDGVQSALARVSLVNFHGGVLLDEYVKPIERVTDYRTHVSGIEPHHLKNASSLATVQEKVWSLLQGKILIGHSLKNDFKALLLEHPRRMTRDTSKFRPFRRISRGKSPSLKRLAKEFLGIDFQSGSHDSADDARVAMLLYRAKKDEWENYLFRGEGRIVKQMKRDNKKKKKKTENSLVIE